MKRNCATETAGKASVLLSPLLSRSKMELELSGDIRLMQKRIPDIPVGDFS
jgi:hypothetical protein